MKKIIAILSILLTSAVISPAYALVKTTPTPTVSATPSVNPSMIDQQINTLKEKIASQVAQMKLVEKRGVLGSVSESSNNQITMTDIQGNTRFIDVDELTKFSSSTNKTFGFADITKGMKIGVLGNYNKESKRILARFITVKNYPTVLSGVLVSTDTKNLYFHIATESSKDTLIDIETTSKMYLVTKTSGIQKVGFSKIKPGARVFVIGAPDKKVPSMIVASSFYALTDIPVNPKLASLAPTTILSPTTTPSVLHNSPTPSK